MTNAVIPEKQNLEAISGEVNRLHGEIEVALRNTIQNAVRIGELLSHAKKQVGHGSFGKWLSAHVSFSDRTARRYMTVYENRQQLLETDSVSDLTTAYRLLQAPKASGNTANMMMFAEYDLACSEARAAFPIFRATLDDPEATIDEVKAIHDRAAAIEVDLTERRIRIERLLGQLLKEDYES